MRTERDWLALPRFVWDRVFFLIHKTYTHSECKAILKVFRGRFPSLPDSVTRAMPLFAMVSSFDNCMDVLKPFRFLRNISLPGVVCSETVDLTQLASFEWLQVLLLQNFNLPLRGPHSLEGLTHLGKLTIANCHVSKELLVSISHLRNLYVLRLKSVKCREGGENVLALLPKNLCHLEIEDCSELHGGNLHCLQTLQLHSLKLDLHASQKMAMESLNHVPAKKIHLTILEAQHLNQFEYILHRNHRIASLSFIGQERSMFPTFVTKMNLSSLTIMNPIISISKKQIEELPSLEKLSLTLERSGKGVVKALEDLSSLCISLVELRFT